MKLPISRDRHRFFKQTKSLRTNEMIRNKGVVQKKSHVGQIESFKEMQKLLFFKKNEKKLKTNDLKSFEPI